MKTAIVTGGAQGIGRGIVESFLTDGWFVLIADVQAEPDSIKELDQCNISYLQIDVTNQSDHQKIIDLLPKLPKLGCLVNNAGVAPKERMDLLDSSPESYDFVMSINLKGPFFLTQAVSNYMIAKPVEGQSIINIGSISSWTASVSRGEYCISKAGVSMMTKLYATRLAEHNIMVYEIQPGIIKTPMTEAVTEKYDLLFEQGITPIAKWGYPDDIAKAAVTLADGLIPYSTGQVIHVDGGFHLRIL